jgi:hypothetical protein
MDEKTITTIITLVIGSIIGFLLTYASDKRKHQIETRKELRLAYARWFSLQRTAFHQITSLYELVSVEPSNELSGNLAHDLDIQEQLKEFQTTFSTLLQNVVEVSLLETKKDRLESIKILDDSLNEFRSLLLDFLRSRKKLLEQFITLDRFEASAKDAMELASSIPGEKASELGERARKIGEKIEKFRAEDSETRKTALSKAEVPNKNLFKHMEDIDINIREFFDSLKGKL